MQCYPNDKAAPFMENSPPETDFNEYFLATMPHFIAVNYQRLLAAQTALERVELALHIYNLSLRILTIGLVSQYVFKDKGERKATSSPLRKH
jgi:hypothetical protein